MLYLLLKEHIDTGLKYLCKKETDDESVCYTYLGSGTFWKKHLKKHGNNICYKISTNKPGWRRMI